jgi:hypothetical protein
MSKIIKYWCDSGANSHSCLRDSVTLEQLNLTEEEWLALTEEEKDHIMRDIALDRLDWGYSLEDE